MDKSSSITKQIRGLGSVIGSQRLGQAIYHALSYKDMPSNLRNYDIDFHKRLMYIDDEELIKALADWSKFVSDLDKNNK